ncbi:MAG: PaaI family thioesterase [Thaumarchaeota archaeon]|nr:PaaI family thioesterase [Nitrososphaerota archaeon]
MSSLRARFAEVSVSKEQLPPIFITLGMKLVKVGKGRATITMDVGKKFHNPMGTVHGGVITDLADAAMGVAVISTLEEKEAFTTLELKMNFLRPVYAGKLTAEGKVVHRGKTIVLVESVVINENRKAVARGVATQMILKARPTPS